MNFFGFTIDFFRKRRGQGFRKQLGVFNYKIGKNGYHKNPGAIELSTKEQLKKKGLTREIFKMEQKSERIFGRHGAHKFIFDKNKVPFYDVPDLTGFELKPYVSVHTPKIELDLKLKIKKLNDFKDLSNFGRFPLLPEQTITQMKDSQSTVKKQDANK